MSTDSIEKMYKNFGILADAKDKISEHEEEYKEIREAVKGSAKEKRLASQFIARFFKHFPHLADKSIEALLDLCEDEDVSIRKQAIKDLPTLCKDNVEHTPKIADILAQLLMTEDNSELAVVHNSFMTLFKMDPKGTLCGVFSQILTGEEPTRVRCLKFLNTKVKTLGRAVIVKEAEDYIITECKRVIQDANADEFYLVMELLGWSRLSQSVAGQKEMIEIVATKMELDQEEFDPVDEDQVDRLIHCVRHALPYFSSQVESGQFVSYMCRSVLSCLSRVKPLEDSPDPQLDILKLFAELCTHCSKLPDPDVNVEKVLQRLSEFMPLPPTSDDDAAPSLEFSYVECLIYSFHRLARQAPEVLTKDVDRLKDFRLRLQYFARGIQGYIKKLREALKGKSGDELKTDENKMKVIALKTTSNINTLIKDLFHSPPSYKSNISLSWRPITLSKASSSEGSDSGGTKRHAQITFDAVSTGAKQSRTSSTENRSNRELYQPPSGKYSNKVSSYLPRGGRGGGIGRGRMRGGSFRGNGRGWRRPIF